MPPGSSLCAAQIPDGLRDQTSIRRSRLTAKAGTPLGHAPAPDTKSMRIPAKATTPTNSELRCATARRS